MTASPRWRSPWAFRLRWVRIHHFLRRRHDRCHPSRSSRYWSVQSLVSEGSPSPSAWPWVTQRGFLSEIRHPSALLMASPSGCSKHHLGNSAWESVLAWSGLEWGSSVSAWASASGAWAAAAGLDPGYHNPREQQCPNGPCRPSQRRSTRRRQPSCTRRQLHVRQCRLRHCRTCCH